MTDTTHERNARLWKRTLLANFGAGARPANLRNVTRKDILALGTLFFDAFLGTIDDAGQAVAQYESKAMAIVAGRYLECCTMITVGNDASEQLFEKRGFSPETARRTGTA